ITRNFVRPGQWLAISLSPTSATTMEWVLQNLFAHDLAEGTRAGDPFGFIEREIASIADDPSEIVFLPFLFGSPLSQDASGGFCGVRGWHTRGHLLRAVMEGIAFTHRHHVEQLAAGLPVHTVRLTGGASRSPRWVQLFADVLALPVEITGCPEASALGVAQLAGVAAEIYPNLDAAVAATVRVSGRFEPGPDHARYHAAYARYQGLVEALRPWWVASATPDPDREGKRG
ncbi:MAG: FGGY-family carbohydrate kinase, partial [Actinomycetales bacterium]